MNKDCQVSRRDYPTAVYAIATCPLASHPIAGYPIAGHPARGVVPLGVIPQRIKYRVGARRGEVRDRPSIKTPAPRPSRSQECFELILIQPARPNTPLERHTIDTPALVPSVSHLSLVRVRNQRVISNQLLVLGTSSHVNRLHLPAVAPCLPAPHRLPCPPVTD